MSEPVRPDSTVSYTVKELLDEQTNLLRGIDHKVDGKADKADLVPITQELTRHHERLSTLEVARREDESAKGVRRRAWAVAGTIGGIVAIIAGSLIAAFVH